MIALFQRSDAAFGPFGSLPANIVCLTFMNFYDSDSLTRLYAINDVYELS